MRYRTDHQTATATSAADELQIREIADYRIANNAIQVERARQAVDMSNYALFNEIKDIKSKIQDLQKNTEEGAAEYGAQQKKMLEAVDLSELVTLDGEGMPIKKACYPELFTYRIASIKY